MREKPVEPPERADVTLKDIAVVCEAIDTSEMGAARYPLLKLLAVEPLASMYREIEDLARDAGISTGNGGWERDALERRDQLERLLASEDWQDPAEVIELSGLWDVKHEELLSLCQMWKAEGRRPIGALERVEAKLEKVAERARAALARRRRAEDWLTDSFAEGEEADRLERLWVLRSFLRSTEVGDRLAEADA